MISTCAGIDKYAFYLDFKGVLSSKPQVSVGSVGSKSTVLKIDFYTLPIQPLYIDRFISYLVGK
jgi:hypothetical protein